MKIQYTILICILSLFLLSKQSLAQKAEDIDTVFKISYFSSDKKTTISEVQFDKTFYVKITYPEGFERTTFNLHELNFMSGEIDNRYNFDGVMIAYSIESETSNDLLVSCKFKNDEDVQITIEMMKSRFKFDVDGNLILEAELRSSSSSIPIASNQLILKID